MPKTPPWQASIIDEHFEELHMLWELRQASLRDLDYDAGDLQALDERIEAHTDGLLLAEDHAQALLDENIVGGEAPLVFAAAYVLLRRNDEASAKLVINTLETAEEDEQITGLKDALCYGPIRLLTNQLHGLLSSANNKTALAAAEALAFHGQLPKNSQELVQHFHSEDPETRAAAWNVVALLGE